MKKIVGFKISKTTQKRYEVKWDIEERTSLIKFDTQSSWQKVCEGVKNAEDAISCAQRYIDSQPYLF